MWWSDWGKNPRIERANMDGTNRTAIVSDDLYWPNAVAVDVYKQKIYFMDAKLDFIDLCNYDGSARRRLVINHDVSHSERPVGTLPNYFFSSLSAVCRGG